MIKSKLYQVLSQFSKPQCNRLIKFSESPYHNSNQQVTELLRLLIDAVFSAAIADKYELWNKVAPEGAPFNSLNFRKLCTDSLHLTEHFLAHEYLRDQKVDYALYQLQAVKHFSLSELYRSSLKRVRNRLNQKIDQGGKLFYQEYQFEQVLYDMEGGNVQRFDPLNLHRILDRLDTTYITEKLRYHCEILSRKSFSTQDLESHLINVILEGLPGSKYLEVPLINIYYQIIQSHLDPQDESHYYRLRELLDLHGQTLPKKEMSQVYQSALNYCNRKINDGKSQFLSESFTLYKQFLQGELILEKGEITHWTFKNVVILALRLKEFEWAKQFIHRYGQYISKSHRSNAITYNLAQLYFYQERYPEVLSQLQEVKYQDVTYNLGSKAMLLATYYELDEVEALHSLAASFRLYLNRRKTTISSKRRTSYLNYINITLKLMSLRSSDHKGLQALSEKMSKLETVASENWLREKLESKLQNSKMKTEINS